MSARATTLISAVLCVCCVLALPAAPAPSADEGLIDRFLAQSRQTLGYRAMRRLEAAGKGQSGWLDAETTFSPGSGLRFSVLAEGGSSYIRSRVLRFLLEQEQQLIARGGVDAVAISPANYTFLPDGTTEEGLARVTIEPRRKEGALIVGHMFIRPGDGELIRVEGRLAKNPSFWVTRAEVVRTYRRLNGAIVPTALETVAQLRMFGSSHLRMSYRYVEIDNRPVEE